MQNANNNCEKRFTYMLVNNADVIMTVTTPFYSMSFNIIHKRG